MEDVGSVIGVLVKAVVAGFAMAFGWMPDVMQVLMLMMTVDMTLGTLCSKMISKDYSRERWLLGVVQKCGIAFIAAMGWVVEQESGLKVALLIGGWFVGHEALSIVKHLRMLGVPMPPFVVTFIVSLQKKMNNEGSAVIKKQLHDHDKEG